MPEESIRKWRQSGEIYLWHYPNLPRRSHYGWNFSADVEGVTALVELIDLLLSSPYGNRRRVETTSFTNKQFFHLEQARFAMSLTLICPADQEPNSWQLTASSGNVSLTVGRDRLKTLRESVAGILVWKQDYTLSPDDKQLCREDVNAQSLWFWTTSTRPKVATTGQ